MPVRLTVRTLPVAPSVIVRVPVRVPVAVGVKVTLIEQLAPAAREVPHVLDWAYRELAEILVILRATVPRFVSVAICAALAVFNACVPKFNVVGERVTFAPVPVRAII